MIIDELIGLGAFDADRINSEAQILTFDPGYNAKTYKHSGETRELVAAAAGNLGVHPLALILSKICRIAPSGLEYKGTTYRTPAQIATLSGILGNLLGVSSLDIDGALADVRATASIREDILEATEGAKEVLAAYNELIEQGWSDLDETIWSTIKCAPTDDDGYQYLIPTGEGSQYRIVGVSTEELYLAMQQLPSPDASKSVAAYIDEHVTKPICLAHNNLQPITANEVVGTNLSAAFIDAGYALRPLKAPVTKEAPQTRIIGYQLGYFNPKHRPTIPDYIKSTQDKLRDKHRGHYIDKLVPISNDPTEPTLRYMSNDLRPGPIDMWEKLFNEGAPTPEYAKDYLDTFATWLALTFDASSTNRQCVIAVGDSGSGKSALGKAIEMFLGPSICGALELASLRNKSPFANRQFIGKRFMYDFDLKDYQNIVQEGWFHQVTSGDPMKTDQKFKSTLNFTPCARLYFGCNKAPTIRLHHDNERSRVILMQMSRPRGREAVKNFHNLLAAQAEALAAYGKSIMHHTCPDGVQIVLSPRMEALIDQHMGDQQEQLVGDALEELILPGGPTDFVPYGVLSTKMQHMLEKHYSARTTPDQIIGYLERMYHAHPVKRTMDDGVRRTCYVGVRFRNPTDASANGGTPHVPPRRPNNFRDTSGLCAAAQTIEF